MFKHRVCWILIDWLNHPRPKRSTQAVTGTWLGNESWPTMVKLTLFDPVFLTYCDILFEYGAWWSLKIHWLYYTDWIWIWLNAVFSVSYDFLCVSAVRVPDPTWITQPFAPMINKSWIPWPPVQLFGPWPCRLRDTGTAGYIQQELKMLVSESSLLNLLSSPGPRSLLQLISAASARNVGDLE